MEAVGMEHRARGQQAPGGARADQASPLTPQHPPFWGPRTEPPACLSWTHLRDDEEVVPGLPLDHNLLSVFKLHGLQGVGHRQMLPLLQGR